MHFKTFFAIYVYATDNLQKIDASYGFPSDISETALCPVLNKVWKPKLPNTEPMRRYWLQMCWPAGKKWVTIVSLLG